MTRSRSTLLQHAESLVGFGALAARLAALSVTVGLWGCSGPTGANLVALARPCTDVAASERPDSVSKSTTSSQSTAAPDSRAIEGDTLLARESWRAGGGLAAPVAVGPDSALYVASRQGNLDVLEANGRLRFSVNLGGGAALEPLYVDERGACFAATTSGVIVGVDAAGRRIFTYRPPAGVRSGLTFTENVGLLFRGRGNTLLGINRMGYPTFRYDSPKPIAQAPFGIWGRCVALTSDGELFGISRFGTRRTYLRGLENARLARANNGELWVRHGSSLVAFTRNGEVSFEMAGVLTMATLTARDATATASVVGVVLTKDGMVRWLDGRGKSVTERQLPDALTARLGLQISADEQRAWVSSEGAEILRVARTGPIARAQFEEKLGAPTIGKGAEGAWLGTWDGRVLLLANDVHAGE